MSKPDWEFWRHVPEIELWQAVCLSQDTEPDEHDQEDVACEDFFRGNKTGSRRLRLLAQNLVPKGNFSRFIIDYEDPHKSKVRLSEFATWAVSVVEWEGLPPELLAVARALPNAEKTAAPPALVEAPEQPDTATSGATEKALAGITKREILSVDWPIPPGAPTLQNILDNLPKWVEEACTKVGRAGKGADGSHLWNPAILAVCLNTKTSQKQWAAGKGALTNCLRQNFPDYLEHWEEAAKSL